MTKLNSDLRDVNSGVSSSSLGYASYVSKYIDQFSWMFYHYIMYKNEKIKHSILRRVILLSFAA